MSRSHAYLQSHPAPDFWVLMPYYVPQATDASCGLASLVMAVNAARAERDLKADEPLATEAGLADWLDEEARRKLVRNHERGYSLDELTQLLLAALPAYGEHRWQAYANHVDQADDAARTALRELLITNEKSADDLLIANFEQGVLTGDPAGNVGHFAPLAAFDAEHDLVLILDPDRRWYEPYWVPLDMLLQAMATRDPTNNQSRGYIHIRR